MRKTLVSTATAVILATSFTGTALGATHEVKSGDSLWKIASNYNTSVAQLKELNKLKSDLIYPKQVLFVTPDEANKEQTNKPAAQTQKEATVQKETTTQSAQTYKVVSGDNLSKIAAKHKVSVADLYKWNNLKSDLIHPGLVLKISNATQSNTPSSNTNQVSTNKPATESNKNNNVASNTNATYKVVSGDTLGAIARKYGTTVKELKAWNNLSSDLILVGQVLIVNSTNNSTTTPAKPETPKVSTEAAAVIDIAKKAIGTKYVWGGSTLSGFDCSGFIYYVFNQSGKKISRLSTDGYYNRTQYINKPEPGDLVFFENTYKKGISHMGIFLGNGQFVHAGSKGVEIASLSNSYWKSKFDGYKRFY